MSTSASASALSRDTVSSAVSSLGKWMRERSAGSKAQLLLDERDDFLVLLLALRRVPAKDRTNPFFLPIPHSLFPLADPTLTLAPSVFLIIDDRAKDSPPPSKFLQEAQQSHLPVSEAIGISTLRTDYKPFESRRKLCGSHDLFIADKKILPLLSRLLGKHFFQKKKNPLPVNFSRVGWKDQIKRILHSTFFYLRSGTCSAIRVGRLSMEVDHIVDNVMAVVDEAVQKIPKKWGNVRSLHLKAVDSVALPIYQTVPEIGLKIEVGEKEDSAVDEVIDGGEEEVTQKNEVKKEKKKKKKGGIRYMDAAAFVGEELVEEGGEEEEGEKEKNKKRKKRSKESTGSQSTVDEKEVKTKKKKKAAGIQGESLVDEAEVKPKKKQKKKGDVVGEPNIDKMDGELKKKKKNNSGGKSDILDTEAKTKKKRQEKSEVEVVESAKTAKMKAQKLGSVGEVKKGKMK
ncbi:60S ribosomal protein L10a [Rhynchospora pubera]|uniref:60S ribosomal protein L10a n=1 Tax=Rhynchospora pubera TaxID=906938 RepID=A0AAV8FW73_9POAL|nr:60S ribosomal protein L10a [Rhynchospora pubera]